MECTIHSHLQFSHGAKPLFFEIPSKLITLMLFVFEVTTVLNSFLAFTIALVCTKFLILLFLAKDRI